MPQLSIRTDLGSYRYTVEAYRRTGNIAGNLQALTNQIAELNRKKALYVAAAAAADSAHAVIVAETAAFIAANPTDTGGLAAILKRLESAKYASDRATQKVTDTTLTITRKTDAKAAYTAKIVPDVRDVYAADRDYSITNFNAVYVDEDQAQLYVHPFLYTPFILAQQYEIPRRLALLARMDVLSRRVDQLLGNMAASDTRLQALVALHDQLQSDLAAAQADLETVMQAYLASAGILDYSDVALAQRLMLAIMGDIQKNYQKQQQEKLKKIGFQRARDLLNVKIAALDYRKVGNGAEIHTGVYPQEFEPTINSGPAAVVYNMCLYAARQRHRPTYRSGVVTGFTDVAEFNPGLQQYVTFSYAGIDLAGAYSVVRGFATRQRFSINQVQRLEMVPVSIGGFTDQGESIRLAVGDTVIVGFYENWSTPRVIGVTNKVPRPETPVGPEDTEWELISYQVYRASIAHPDGLVNLNYRRRWIANDTPLPGGGNSPPHWEYELVSAAWNDTGLQVYYSAYQGWY
jgi:hypothetical protein